MAFCPNCGAPVEGRFCAKCGANTEAPAAGWQQPPQTAPPAGAGGLSDNVAGALCYIPIVAVIFLLIEPYNRNKAIRFHAFQSIFLFVAMFVLFIALSIVSLVLGQVSFILASMFGLVQMLISLCSLLLWVYLLVMTIQDRRIVLPVVGPMAEKQA